MRISFLFLHHVFPHSLRLLNKNETSGLPQCHFLCPIVFKIFYYPLPLSVLEAINSLQISSIKQGSMPSTSLFMFRPFYIN